MLLAENNVSGACFGVFQAVLKRENFFFFHYMSNFSMLKNLINTKVNPFII